MSSKTDQPPVAGIENEGVLKLLEAVDTLRREGVGKTLSLPQLVVVGDQSCGKSSLLEGLTGVSFPVASDLCTRFATQVVLRRSPDEEASVTVSIIPGRDAREDPGQRQKLENFEKTFPEEEFGPKLFNSIMDEAAEVMGLPKPGTEDITTDFPKRFSNDILRIELSSPEHSNLSFVDVPGLFHNATKYQTLDDAKIIRDLIEEYVTDRRTIIIAVMDARNNLANQEVFRMARAADPEGKRTVGVITKCDALQPGEEAGVFKTAQNTVEHLAHGWFLVKNRSAKDIQNGVTIAERHINEEAFFKNSQWAKLGKDRLGIKALKPFLGKLLHNHVRGEFPGMIKEIRKMLEDAQQELYDLGPSRSTSVEQRLYLTRLANDYQGGVRRALDGNYESKLVKNSPLKLRARLQSLNEKFAASMREKGHKWEFKGVGDVIDPKAIADKIGKDETDIYAQIQNTYFDCRGPELPGLINPYTLQVLFRQQSEEWDSIAHKHVNKVDQAIRDFNVEQYVKSILDESVRAKLLARMLPLETGVSKTAREVLDRRLKDERCAILQTMDNGYADTLNTARYKRILNRLERANLISGKSPYSTIDIEAVSRVVHLSNVHQAVYDIHDILKAYYNIALKRFVDNVIRQVVEYRFLGEEGLVRLFTTEYVGGLEDHELNAVAGEDEMAARCRAGLKVKVDSMKNALAVALAAMS